jgi:hypothetical protein
VAPRLRLTPGDAWSLVPLAAVLAAIAALVTTMVYASVDARKPLVNEPTTVVRSEARSPRPSLSDERPTVTRAPVELTPEQLHDKLAASVRTVRTRNEAGEPVEGTAFVAGAFGGRTLLLTSLAVVRAATQVPAPPVVVGQNREATLWTWQEDRDLALLTLGGNIETLPFVSSASGARVGDKLYTLSGDRLVSGTILATGTTAVEHNIRIDDAMQGAPLVNQKGEVVAVASRVYDPGGKGTESLFIGVPVGMACEQVLRCGEGNVAPKAEQDKAGSASTTTRT